VFVFLHGGYWQSGTIKLYGSLAKSLARLGVVTVSVEYRLYPQVTFPAFMDDAVAALNWVRAHIGEFGGDPNRIVLSGHSAGAHMAALLLVDDRFRNVWLSRRATGRRGAFRRRFRFLSRKQTGHEHHPPRHGRRRGNVRWRSRSSTCEPTCRPC
jgi:carboxylesterase type B